MAMRAPRIMQRKRAIPYEKSGQQEPGPSTATTAAVADDIDEVLDQSNVYIQDGVMMRIEDSMSNEELRIAHEESDYTNERCHTSTKDRRSITVDDLYGYGENTPRYIENRLPGMADDVECYQCKVCASDKVYLTGIALEKHTRACHKEHLPKVLREIDIIEREWIRRKEEREKIKERKHAQKIRNEALANAAAREIRMGTSRNLRRWNQDGSFNYVIPSDQLNIVSHGDPGISGPLGGPFDACPICNLQINVSHPIAYETHMRAHSRNYELRDELIEKYGEEVVERLSCNDCELVFTDDSKLRGHIDTRHTRKRKFVCKWCGAVTNSVTELNEHKIDVHAVPVNGGQRQVPIMTIRKEPHSEMKKGSFKNRMEQNALRGNMTSSIGDESQISVTGTSCPDCSLPFNRPSLLLKHMLRVHSKSAFSAFINTKGLPTFSVQVDRGRVVWSCCGRNYNDRGSFSLHRQSHSIATVNEDELIGMGSMESSSSRPTRVHLMPSPQQEVVVSSENMKREIIDSTQEYPIDQNAMMDGTIEIVVPQGVKHDEGVQYMLVVEQDANGAVHKRVVTIDPRSNPEDAMRQHSIGMGGAAIDNTSREGGGVLIDGSNYMEDENGQIIMSTEQFEQFRMQYGDDLSNIVQVLYVDDGHGNRIEDGNEEDNRENNEDDTNTLQHDILEPSES